MTSDNCPYLAFCCWAFFPNPVEAQLDPELEKPYHLQVVLHVADNRFLTPVFQDQLQRALRDQLALSFGPMAKIEVVRAHPLLAELQARGLESGLDGWQQISGVQTHFVLVDFAEGIYVIQTRSYDGMTGLLDPAPRAARTSDRALVAREAARLVEQGFAPVGTVTETGKDIETTLKGGKLGANMDRWVKPGEVFAISRMTSEGDKLRGTRVPWALLEVLTAPRAGVCRCRLWHRFQEDDLRDRPGVLGYRCLQIATVPGPLTLRILDEEQQQPLAFLQVQVQKPGSAKSAELTTNRDGLLVTRENYQHFALVRILSGQTVRAQFPVPITGAGPVLCRLKVKPEAEAQSSLEWRRDQWLRRILDNLRLASERVALLNRELSQSLDQALETAQGGIKTMDSEVNQLAVERVQIQRLVDEKKISLDLRDGDLGLGALRKKKEELEHFLKRTQDVLKESKSEQTLGLAKMLERARLLEGEGEFDQALAFYEKVLQASPDQPKVKEHLSQLKAAWAPKSPQHAEARAFLVQTWPGLEVSELKKNLDKAQAALAVCREAKDRLTPIKVMQADVLHAAHLQTFLETLKRQDSVDNRTQARAVVQVIEGLRRLHAEAGQLRNEK